MNILVLTSADHCYANVLLNILIRGGIFSNHSVVVLEQYGIVPGKSKLFVLRRYLSVAGISYVFRQVLKQYSFEFMRWLRDKQGRRESIYFPYWKQADVSLERYHCPRLANPEAVEFIKKFHPDVILSLFSKEIIPKSIFSLALGGCVNLHPAPLPYYRGVSPTFWILANGEKTAGVTLHAVDAGMDTGKIISQRKFPTNGIVTEHALYMRATVLGAGLVADFLTKKHRFMKNPKKGSYYSLPTKDAVSRFFGNGCKFFRLKEFIFS